MYFNNKETQFRSENTALRSEVTFPGIEGTTLRQFPGDGLRPGNQDPVRQEVVR